MIDDLQPTCSRAGFGQGFLDGDFQFATDPTPPTTSCAAASSRVTARSRARVRRRPDQRALSRDDWQGLISTSRTRTRPEAFRQYSTHYLATSGQIYYSDAHQFADYMDGYHRAARRRAECSVSRRRR